MVVLDNKNQSKSFIDYPHVGSFFKSDGVNHVYSLGLFDFSLMGKFSLKMTEIDSTCLPCLLRTTRFMFDRA